MKIFLRSGGALLCAITTTMAQSAESAACAGVRPRSGTLGIGHYECVGSGSGCIVNERLDGGYAHLFTTEPAISDIDPKGPASGVLKDGDLLVAVDRLLVTTREGGRRLANLEAGRPVDLRIRRGTSQVDLTLTPVLGCEIPSLSVYGPGTSSSRGQRAIGSASHLATTPIDLGMRLECGSCGWRVGREGTRRWYASESPIVVGVDEGGPAQVAGVRRGDVLEALDGASFVAPDGSSQLGTLRTGRPLVLVVRREGASLRLQITPRAAP